MNQLPENSLCTYDVTLVTSYLTGLPFNKKLCQASRAATTHVHQLEP